MAAALAALAAAVMLGVCAAQAPYPNDPAGVPVSFMCAWREFAYEYGTRLRPSAAPLLFDALQLGALCNQTAASLALRYKVQHEEVYYNDAKFNIKPDLGGPGPSTVYVNGRTGSDSNPGTAAAPKKTIAAGIGAARGLPRPAAVVIHAGTYYLEQPLHLDERDSHLTITGAGDGEVWLSGAAPVSALQWKPFNVNPNTSWVSYPNVNNARGCSLSKPSDPNCGCHVESSAQACKAACVADKSCTSYTWHDPTCAPNWKLHCCVRRDGVWDPYPEAGHVSGRLQLASNIYVASVPGALTGKFSQLRINRTRVPKARHPNGNPETDQYPVSWANKTLVSKWIFQENHGGIATPVLVNNSAIATRGSADFQLYIGGIGGPCSIFDPPFSYWCATNASGGGAFEFYKTIAMELAAGVLPTSGFKRNSLTNPPIAQVWHRMHWCTWMFTMDYVASNRTMLLTKGGFQGARGGRGSDFYVENAFELLDAANEWFFDDSTNELYVFFANQTDPTKTPPTVEAVFLQDLIIANATQSSPIVNLSITNIGFKDAAPTYLEPHAVPSGGDWALERRAAVFFEGTIGLSVANCSWTRVGGNGLMLSGFNRNASITNNHFAWTGGSAMAAWGRTDEISDKGIHGWDGTGGDFPRWTNVAGNLVHETGIWQKQASCWFQAKTAQTTLRGNVCFNLARAGFNFNDGFGGGDHVTGNLIFNSCRESADHGPINSWDRQPYVTTVYDGTPSAVMLPRNITFNFLAANYGGGNGAIDNDDGSLHFENNHNFQVYGRQKFKTGAIRSYGNVLAYVSRYGVAWGAPGSIPSTPNAMYNNTVICNGRCSYHNCDPWHAHNNHLYGMWTVRGDGCNGTYTLKEWQQLDPTNHDVGSTDDPTIPPDGEIISWARRLLFGATTD